MRSVCAALTQHKLTHAPQLSKTQVLGTQVVEIRAFEIQFCVGTTWTWNLG